MKQAFSDLYNKQLNKEDILTLDQRNWDLKKLLKSLLFARCWGPYRKHGVIAVILIESSITIDCLQQKNITGCLSQEPHNTVVLEAKWHLCPECYKSTLVSVLFFFCWPVLQDNQCMVTPYRAGALPHLRCDVLCCRCNYNKYILKKMCPLDGRFPKQNQSLLWAQS